MSTPKIRELKKDKGNDNPYRVMYLYTTIILSNVGS